MKTKDIIKKLKSLKATALKDEKLDVSEVNDILDFMRQYCKIDTVCFNNLKRILLIAKDDNNITKLETTAIVDALNDVLTFLKWQYIFEFAITCMTGLAVVGAIATYVLLTI